jgi:putative PIN family toxin of toxin-antitoxin system
MREVRRIVIDTSTLIGAVLRPQSKPRQALILVAKGFELCVSRQTLHELEEVLNRPKFDRYAPLQTRLDFLALVTQGSRLWEVDAESEQMALGACRDDRDNKFLALGLACKAVAIVSSDADLLTLGTWKGIRITTPADFLAIEQR